jgi:adenosylcobinamide kinase/adenosylcobinamide-phosphate guanylyltransferase
VLIVLVGGARSGKSALAVELGRAQAAPVTFVATATATDRDMEARIARHRAERPTGWRTIEEPLDLAGAIAATAPDACLILDCLSVWTGAAMAQSDPDTVQAAAERVAPLAAQRPGLTIAVTNEVGMGVHPVSALGRDYRDVHGRVNAIWSKAADRSFLVVAGRLLELGPAHCLVEELA